MRQLEVVAAAIVNGDLVLCAQRGGSGPTAYKWELPGGKVEEGESHQEALAREILEELGATIKVGERIASVEYQYEAYTLRLHAYLASLIQGQPKISEHIDARWLGAEDLMGLDWAPADLAIVEKLRERLRAAPILP